MTATGFAGVYTDANPGMTLRLAVSLDINVLDIVKIKATGELRLNTSNADRNVGGVMIGKKSFKLALTGEVKLVEVIKFNASFVIQVGGGALNVGSASDGTAATLNLDEGDWVIDFRAIADFFGFASMDIGGWIDSRGFFACGSPPSSCSARARSASSATSRSWSA